MQLAAALVFFTPVALAAAIALVTRCGATDGPRWLLPAVRTTVLAVTAVCFAAAAAHALTS